MTSDELRATLVANRATIAILGGFVLIGIVAGLTVVVLRPQGVESPPVAVASATPTTTTPSTAPTRATAPAATALPAPATPSPVPTIEARASSAASDPATSGGSGRNAEAVEAAIAGLEALEAYRFETQIAGRSVRDLARDQLLDLATRGQLRQEDSLNLDFQFGFQLVEPGGVASAGSSSHVVVIGDTAWEIRGDRPPLVFDLSAVELLAGVLPSDLARQAVGPIAEGFVLAGRERHAGVETDRYELDRDGRAALERATGMQGSCEGELWIAAAGGHLVGVDLRCTPRVEGGDERGLFLQIEVTDVGDPAIVIEAPS